MVGRTHHLEPPIARADRAAHALASCVALVGALVLAGVQLGPMALDPAGSLVGSHIHPDNLANQWLLPWAVEAVRAGEPLLHTTAYYWPVGDAPLLSGDGTQALLYAPLHLLLGWPAAPPVFVGLTLVLNGLAGWFAARSVTRSGWAALVAVPICGASPFVMMELSAGRFSQAAVWPLALFLGLWWRYLARPGPGLAVLSAVALAYTSFSYWYYGWFGVLAGALAWGATLRDHTGPALRAHLRWHGLFSAVFLVSIAPWAWLFLSHWGSVPGSAETEVFPPASTLRDRLPYLLALRPGDPTTTAAAQSLVGLGLAVLGAVVGRTRRAVRGWMVVGLVFLVLGWGPAFPGAPYTVLYGLTAALRRFWWPMRHVVVVQLALAVLSAQGVAWLCGRWCPARGAEGAVGLGLAGAVAASIGLQGLPTQLEHTPLTFPPEGYAALAERPEGAVVVLPLAPEATGTNDALLHQLAHGHPIVTGHSPWVARARPAAWDRWVQEQGLLRRIVELERSGWAGGTVSVEPAEVAALQAAGVRWIVLDRTLVPLALKGMVRAHDGLMDGIFGRPTIRTADVQVWEVRALAEVTAVEVPGWTWPSELRPAGPQWPLAARRPQSPMLGTPSGHRGPSEGRSSSRSP